jgi:membrane peptidoglycan carboxypeptidase
MVLAMKLEEVYSKDQILEAYLNNIPYGGVLYGIESASQSYFGVPARDLSVPQAAYLAAMIQAPSYYSPFGPNRAKLDERKNLVLDRMASLGFIDKTTLQESKNTVVAFSSSGENSVLAPHFVFYILDQLSKEFGDTALKSGLKVTTTLDADLQVQAESIVRRYAAENTTKFRASNAALTAVDPKTGQILSMVGSRNFFDTTIDGQYNTALALRQPGSTMKPFVYALALKNGFTRKTVVFDVPTQFSTACSPSDVSNMTAPCYAPQNFDNQFRGPMTFDSALAQSINIPAIKTLYMVGIQNAITFAKTFGLTTLGDPNTYGLTLVLGGGEVRLLDLVGAYSVFANDGVLNKPTGILEVTDAKGTTLKKYEATPSDVISNSVARDMSEMLSNPNARLPEYPLDSPLSVPGYEVAVKTGTTNDTRDAWVVGYTPSIALGVWVGNNDNSTMVKSIAGMIAAPMWNSAMRYAVSKYPKEYFGEPTTISTSLPQMLQGNWRIPDATGSVVPHSELYWYNKNNPAGSAPSYPAQDPQFNNWEYGVSAWYNRFPNLFASL